MGQHILIATNNSAQGAGVVEYGIWLARLLNKDVTLLGIFDNIESQPSMSATIAQARASLAAKNLTLTEKIVGGNPLRALFQTARASEHLVIVGPLGRPGWLRFLRGRSFRHILKVIQAPLIYVPQPHLRLQKILVCMGGLGYARSVEHWALSLARMSSASLTLLHVIEPVYYEYPTSQQVQLHENDLIHSETPQGQNLRGALQDAQKYGVPTDLKVRQGEIIREITREISVRPYDLIAMGSPESSHSLRHRVTSNVTAQIAERCHLPVLVARLGQEPIE